MRDLKVVINTDARGLDSQAVATWKWAQADLAELGWDPNRTLAPINDWLRAQILNACDDLWTEVDVLKDYRAYQPHEPASHYRYDMLTQMYHITARFDVVRLPPDRQDEEEVVDSSDYRRVKWRTGRSVGRTIYAVRVYFQTFGDEPVSDVLIGMMDTPALAEAVVEAHNAQIGE